MKNARLTENEGPQKGDNDMDYPEYCYVDFGLNSASKRYILHVKQVAPALEKAGHKNCFLTWYRFPQTVKDAGTVRGYSGPCMADFLPFDFDNVQEPKKALSEARKFVAWLETEMDVSCDSLRFYFSGRKGFHLMLPAQLFGGFVPSSMLPKVLKAVAKDLAGDLLVDMAIYDAQRFLRIENTTHETSGLYKIPLTPYEFLNLEFDEITSKAKEPRHVDCEGELGAVPALMEIYQKQLTGERAELPRKSALQDLFRSGMEEGEGRDEQAFRIACWCRDQGMKPTGALQVLKLWDAGNKTPLQATNGGNILQVKIASAYKGVASDILTVDSIKNVKELATEYTQYVENMKKRKVLLGFPTMDKKLRGVAPGELMFLIARASVGKSAFIQNVQRKMNKAKQWSLFISLEQPLPQCFERMVQMSAEISGEQAETLWTDPAEREFMLTDVIDQMAYSLVMGDSLKSTDIPTAVQLAEEKAGEHMSCILIDYLGYIHTDSNGTTYERISQLARELKQTAKRIDRAIICIAQTNRTAGGDGTEPLTLASARDSGAIEESGDFVLGLYQQKAIDERMMPLVAQILKNRKGYTGEVLLTMDRVTLRIEEAIS